MGEGRLESPDYSLTGWDCVVGRGISVVVVVVVVVVVAAALVVAVGAFVFAVPSSFGHFL